MSGVWDAFLRELAKHNVELADIAECNTTTLQTLLAEFGFSALVSAKLQTEWSRRQAAHRLDAMPFDERELPSASTQQSLSASSVPRGATLTQHRGGRFSAPSDSAEHVEASEFAKDFFAAAAAASGNVVSILSVEVVSNANRERASRDARSRQCRHLPTQRLARLVPLDRVDKTIEDGPVPHPTVDRAMSFGYVFHQAVDDIGPAAKLFGPDAVPSKLVIFDVAVGEPRIMSEDDAVALQVYSPDDVQAGLRQEGCDSIQIQRSASSSRPDVVVVFDPRLAVAKYVVTFTCSDANDPSVARNRSASMSMDRSAVVGSAAASAPLPATTTVASGALCQKYGKPLEFWHRREKRLLCSHCLFFDESLRREDCLLLDEAAELERPWLQEWHSEATSFASSIRGALGLFDSALDDIDASRDGALDTLAARVEDIKRRIDLVHSELQASVLDKAKAQTKQLQQSVSEVVALQASVDDVMRVSQQALNNGNAVEILMMRQTAARKWQPVDVSGYTRVAAPAPDEALVDRLIDEALVVGEADGAIDLPATVNVQSLAATVDERVPDAVLGAL